MLRPGQAIALCVLALLTIGVVMVNSAGMQVGGNSPRTAESLLSSKTTIYAALAVLAMVVCALLPVRRLLPGTLATGSGVLPDGELARPTAFLFSPTWLRQVFGEYVRLWPLWAGATGLVVVLALVYLPGIERPRNGSHRWITLHIPGFESIQPSEIAKWGLVVLMAWYGARSLHRMKSFWLGFAPGLAAAGLVAGFVVIEDLGTGALLAVAASIVLLAAGGRLWQLLILAPIPAAGAVLAVVTNPYRWHRIEAFLNPYLEPEGKGFHMIQSMAAVAGGGGFGRGLGHGLQKFGYLPEDTTDFLFAIVCEELGIAGAAMVLSLFAGLLWALWLVVRRERLPVFKLFTLGVLATIGVQALINLVVVTGMGPTKGIALPLLSSGGTGWILTAAALGLVIAIDRAQAQEGARLLSGLTGSTSPAPAVMMATVAGAVAGGPALAEPTRADEAPSGFVDTDAQPVAEVPDAPAAAESSAVDDQDGESTEDLGSQKFEPRTEAEVPEATPPETAEPPSTPEAATTDEPSTPTAQPPAQPAVAPGETGLLFDIAPTPAPEVVITKAAKVWADERRAMNEHVQLAPPDTSNATGGAQA